MLPINNDDLVKTHHSTAINSAFSTIILDVLLIFFQVRKLVALFFKQISNLINNKRKKKTVTRAKFLHMVIKFSKANDSIQYLTHGLKR
jgi:hypothetical protein